MNTDIGNIWESKEPAMHEVLNAARIVASTEVTTLITGEIGSGKQSLALAIHDHSPRQQAPFVAVNCGTLPSDQAEPLLFGDCNEQTSDGNTSDGYVCAAAGGTLFLDDVGELAPAAQVKLLHLLERGEIIARGATPPVPVDVRVLAASHRDLAQFVAEGSLHPDLFYRLNVVPLTLPPLRERPRDIFSLADRFLAELASQYDVASVKLDQSAKKALANYPWPGNVRELHNLCERLTLLLPGRDLKIDNLPQEFRRSPEATPRIVALPSSGLDLAELEKDLIAQALKRTGGNRSRAARLLGLTRDTLLYRLKKFALR